MGLRASMEEEADNVFCVYVLSAICICNSAPACNPGVYNCIPSFIFYFPFFYFRPRWTEKKKKKKEWE